MEEQMRVLLVDDHVIFRKGLATLLDSQPDFLVVGEAADGWEALDQARELQPDVVVMDIRLPRCDGLRATRMIREAVPQCAVMILTVSADDEEIFEAIRHGAQGYILKDTSPEELFEALRGISKGEAPLSPVVASRIMEELRDGFRGGFPSLSGLRAALSPREQEILRLVATGFSNKRIALQLCIAPGTVKNHIHNILEKLQMHNRAGAAAYAVREGIIYPAVEGRA
ncbi:MAG: response regulator transcription factor [Chloroflexi bacterium]|nr:response regulator transcription factor [Chloroflexota bacterium]